MGQTESSSIPTLTDVLVPGKPAAARAPAASASADVPHDDAAIPVLTDVIAPGKPGQDAAGTSPVTAAEPAAPTEIDADPDTVIVEPVPTPHVPAVEWPPAGEVAASRAAATEPVVDTLAASRAAAEPVIDTPAAPAAPETIATTPVTLTPEDAQHIAERLRNRLTNYLTGEGREAIEARCRDALLDHSAWLVSQITREVALALETEVMEWVRDAVDDEIARRRTGHSG
ncbi:DUF2486 family protein [Burkholderia sp. MR1-5-21]